MGVTMVQAKIRYEEGSYEGEVNDSKIPTGAGVFNYRGDDEHGRMCYDGEWKNKAADGYGVMKWQNGDRYEGDWTGGLRQGKGKYTCKTLQSSSPTTTSASGPRSSPGEMATTLSSITPMSMLCLMVTNTNIRL